jgi:hypothetical protein
MHSLPLAWPPLRRLFGQVCPHPNTLSNRNIVDTGTSYWYLFPGSLANLGRNSDRSWLGRQPLWSGVGKTFSAEATSEHVKRPLYVIGGRDLGTNAARGCCPQYRVGEDL